MEHKLNIGNKTIGDEQILKHKDFDALLRSYRMVSKPANYKPWYIASASVAAAVILLLLYFGVIRNNVDNNLKTTPLYSGLRFNTQDLVADISVPLAAYTIPAERFKVSNESGGSFKSASGSTITIPAKAFVDSEGKRINGTVEVSYREFQTPLDFFLSGIPMHRNMNGQAVQEASAGMFEILAYKDNEAVFLDKEGVISIDQVSLFGGEGEILRFDTVLNTWISEGENQLVADNGEVVKEPGDIKVSVDSSDMPRMPRKADKKKNIFNISVDVSGFPELTEYRGLLFEVNESIHKFDQRLYDVSWEKASLKASEVPGNYDLTLMARDSAVTIMVYPVINNRDYDEAIRVYQEKKQEWLAEQKKQMEDKPQTARTDLKKEDVVSPVAEQEIIAYSQMKPSGKRHFDVNVLGIYQTSLPASGIKLDLIEPLLQDISGNELHNVRMYVANRNYNMLYDFGNSRTIALDRGAANLFWLVTRDGKIGVLSPESLALLTKSENRPLIRVNLNDPETGISLLKSSFRI